MIDHLKSYPEYRDSGSPWLGMIPTHWETIKTKYIFAERVQKGFPDEPLLAATQTKGVVRKEQYENRTVTALKDLHLLKLVERGDYVISLRSFQGGIEFAHVRGIISPAYTVLKPSSQAHSDYYQYLFKSDVFVSSLTLFITGIREGQNIDYERLSRAQLPMPPAPEQKAIGAFLRFRVDQLNRFIQSKRRLIELLNEQKRAIIHQAVTRGLDPNVRLKPSGIEWIGDIPEHWSEYTLGHVAESLQTGPFGSQLHANEYVTGGLPIINPSHINAGRLTPSPDITVDFETADRLSRHRLAPGDIVFARRGELGRCALVGENEAGWLCGTGSLRMRPRKGWFVSEYLLLLLSSSGVAEILRLNSVGATMDNLNTSILAWLKVPYPPLGEQQTIVTHVSALSDQINTAIVRANSEIDLIREYRTCLIADVVTGKLDVRNVELAELEDVHLLEDLYEDENAEVEETIEAEEAAYAGD